MVRYSVEETILVATDRRELAATSFHPQVVQAAIIVCGGVGISRQYYAAFSRGLAEAGFAVLCFDFRGIGGSLVGDIRRESARMRDWGQLDLPAAIEFMTGKYQGVPLIVIGHSAGLQMLGLASNHAKVCAAYGIAGQSGYWRHWTGYARLRACLLSHLLIPISIRIFGYFPGAKLKMADLPRKIAGEWAHWCRSKDYVVGAFAKERHPQFFAEFAGPARLLSFYDDDGFAPRNAVDAMAKLLTNARIERWHVGRDQVNGRRIGHFGFFRPIFRKTLWADCLDFLRRVTAAHAAQMPLTKLPPLGNSQIPAILHQGGKR